VAAPANPACYSRTRRACSAPSHYLLAVSTIHSILQRWGRANTIVIPKREQTSTYLSFSPHFTHAVRYTHHATAHCSFPSMDPGPCRGDCGCGTRARCTYSAPQFRIFCSPRLQRRTPPPCARRCHSWRHHLYLTATTPAVAAHSTYTRLRARHRRTRADTPHANAPHARLPTAPTPRRPIAPVTYTGRALTFDTYSATSAYLGLPTPTSFLHARPGGDGRAIAISGGGHRHRTRPALVWTYKAWRAVVAGSLL